MIVYLTWDIIGLGGRGEIKYGLKRLYSAPLHADVGSYLSWFFTIQLSAASEKVVS